MIISKFEAEAIKRALPSFNTYGKMRHKTSRVLILFHLLNKWKLDGIKEIGPDRELRIFILPPGCGMRNSRPKGGR